MQLKYVKIKIIKVTISNKVIISWKDSSLEIYTIYNFL